MRERVWKDESKSDTERVRQSESERGKEQKWVCILKGEQATKHTHTQTAQFDFQFFMSHFLRIFIKTICHIDFSIIILFSLLRSLMLFCSEVLFPLETI